ncbi:MAG TPA: DNA polymerase III subunit gamma/tau [Casimicrobiaceae bacterium]|nr:DNA polymerase III subunit gamma/tau [Casimicrobiaceae bacterium]
MTYKALARKWRPRIFAELVGQEHVVTALINGLTRGRLHHAYLLTGTRGVGKTTIARIIAKSLNCANGVTASPCGVCSACVDIDTGRFVDLIEIDAASNTGVDSMREILDNARYAPTVGRTKVYLIDEVHMLSKGAFNSMLKTLEEPPEHVKFVLATTDPQKIPVTVLSRCLQFNLKPLPAKQIAQLVETILDAEGIERDCGGVAAIARAARGSARDALSLLDQAIAYGAGAVREDAVRTMLGAVDREYIYRIADALNAQDGPALLAESDALASRGLAAASALEELAALFHRIAVAQVVRESAANFEDAARIGDYATRFTPESVQLAYQICAQGREDLAIAPDEAVGFSMTLLRLLAFEPAQRAQDSRPTSTAKASSRPTTIKAIATDSSTSVPATVAPVRESAGPARSTPTPTSDNATSALPNDPAQWPSFVAGLKLTGLVAQLAANSELRSIDGHIVNLSLPASHKHLADRAYSDKLKLALEAAAGRRLMLAFEVGEATPASLASRERRERDATRERNEAAFRDEPFVRELVERFEGTVRSDSIKPIG